VRIAGESAFGDETAGTDGADDDPGEACAAGDSHAPNSHTSAIPPRTTDVDANRGASTPSRHRCRDRTGSTSPGTARTRCPRTEATETVTDSLQPDVVIALKPRHRECRAPGRPGPDVTLVGCAGWLDRSDRAGRTSTVTRTTAGAMNARTRSTRMHRVSGAVRHPDRSDQLNTHRGTRHAGPAPSPVPGYSGSPVGVHRSPGGRINNTDTDRKRNPCPAGTW
jgi:hypothetical protein